jgi:hypothetical protein
MKQVVITVRKHHNLGFSEYPELEEYFKAGYIIRTLTSTGMAFPTPGFTEGIEGFIFVTFVLEKPEFSIRTNEAVAEISNR